MKQTKHFKRTALSKSAKSMVSLMLLLIAMLMPQGVWATDFISEVKISSESGNNGNNAKSHLTNNNYTLAGGDLNYGNGKDSWYIYLGYKTDTDASKAITGIMIVSGKDYLGDEYLEGRTKTLSYDGKTWYRSPAQGAADLNKGASGDYLTIFYTRDGNTVNSGKPLVSLSVAEETSLSGYTYAGLYKDGAFSANGSTNVGTSGAARYITYTTHTHTLADADYDATNHKYWCASCGYVSKYNAHEWQNSGSEKDPATCTTAAVHYQKCKYCGRTNDANHTYTTSALGHNFNANGICTRDASHFQEPSLSSGYYQIANYGNLCWFRDKVNGGSYTINAKQTADITIPDGVIWGGIGNNSSSTGFKGTYDGNCHTISGLKISLDHTAFINTTNKATIKNLGLLNVSVSNDGTAGLVRFTDNYTTISNCYVTGSARYPLCYTNYGNSTITNCFAYVTNGAGLALSNYATIRNCFTNLDNIPGTSSNCKTSVSASTFASGEITYLLNSGETGGTQVWYQKLGTSGNALPTLVKNTANTVYRVETFKCEGKTRSGNYAYSNNSAAKILDGHGSAGYTPTYEWGGTYDAATCSFTLKCNLCNNNVTNQNLATSKVQTNHVDATCATAGNERWTATGTYSKAGDAAYNGTAQVMDYAIPATGLHTFADDDPTQSICTVCNHSFLRYSATNKVVPGGNTLLNGSGQNIYHDEKHTFANGKGVIELDEPLVSIGANAFKQCLLTDNLSLPSSVESIGEGAFMGCSGLTSIMFESVPKIGNNAFNGVNCTKNMVLTYDSYLYKVEGGNPYFPEVASVTVPCDLDLTGSAVANRENYTFTHGNKIQEVDEAHYVTTTCINKVYHYSCEKCHGIQAETYTVDGGTGIHIFADDDLEQSECTLCHHGFFRYTSNNNAVVWPKTARELKDKDDKSLTIISNSNGVMEFNKPLVKIGATAFEKCTGFTGDLIIPNTVRFVGTSTFANCTGLNGTLVISRSVENVETFAFYDCNFQRVEMRSVPDAWSLSMYNLRNITVVLSNKSYIKRGSNQYFPDSKYIISVSAPCNLDLSNSVVADHENIIRTHDYRKETLTASPVENGLYAYACDGGCGTHTDDHIIKDFNGEGNHLELTKSGSAYSTTEDVTLADANGFVSPVDFTANSASYTRNNIKNQWGTIVVPFEVDGSGDDYDLYTLSSVSSDELTLTKVNGTLAAGTPALIRINSELANGKTYDLTLTAASNAVNAQGTLEGTLADGLTLTGSYSVKDITDEQGYIISNNKFWSIQDIKGTNHVKCAPFRAYLAGTLSSGNSPQMLSISWSEGTLTSVSDAIEALNSDDTEIYDINGRRISSLRPGVNIVKYANGKTVKVHVK